MKKLLIFLIAILTIFSVACGESDNITSSVAENEKSEESLVTDESSTVTLESATKIISTLDYKNYGKMGDTDGPAFAVYSKVGYSGASVTLDVAKMEINTGLPNGKYVNGYMFLGIDVYSGQWWTNCVDAGLCWSGMTGGWHVFYNIYEPLNESTPTWYESRKLLPRNDIYTLTLTITEDNYALLTVKGLNSGMSDSVKVEVKGAKKDGSNTSMLFNCALDFPPNTKVDSNGQPSEDWEEIVIANSNKGVHMRVHANELKLYRGEGALDWKDELSAAVSIWPDKESKRFDYSPTTVGLFDGTEYYIDLDMNK